MPQNRLPRNENLQPAAQPARIGATDAAEKFINSRKRRDLRHLARMKMKTRFEPPIVPPLGWRGYVIGGSLRRTSDGVAFRMRMYANNGQTEHARKFFRRKLSRGRLINPMI